MQVHTKTQLKQGTIVQLDGKVYQVSSSVDLMWLKVGQGFMTTLKPRFELNERFAAKPKSVKKPIKRKKK
jgi:hypothetical protein